MTQEDQIEYNKCAEDMVYFLNKHIYYYKYSPLLADFKLYPYQEYIMRVMHNEENVVINSSRQMGTSLGFIGYALWRILFTPNYRVLFTNVSTIQGISNLIKLEDSYSRLPEYLKVKAEKNKKLLLQLENGSCVRVAPSSVSLADDDKFDLVIIDNAAFIADLENVVNHLQDHLKEEGKTVIISTPFKKGYFLDLCREGEGCTAPFTYIKLPYYMHPRRERLWRSNIAKLIGEDAAIVEYDCTHYYNEEGGISPIDDDI